MPVFIIAFDEEKDPNHSQDQHLKACAEYIEQRLRSRTALCKVLEVYESRNAETPIIKRKPPEYA